MVEGRCQTRQAGTSFSGQCLGWVETIESTVVLARRRLESRLQGRICPFVSAV